MKFLLVASFLLVCTAAAAVSGTKNISVNGDGSIRITSSTGNQVDIDQEIGLDGESKLEIAISGPGIPTRTIQVEGDLQTLRQILRNFQGVVSESQYQALLMRIGGAAQNGQINPLVFNVLQGLGIWGQTRGLGGLSNFFSRLPQGQQLLNTPLLANQQSSFWNVLGGSGRFVEQPLQTIQEAEETIEKLEAVQQQLQQQIDIIEQLGGLSPVEQQQIARLSDAQQVAQQLEQQEIGQLVQELVDQLQGQQSINQLRGQQQFSGLKQLINQLQGQGQRFGDLRQLINQLQNQQFAGLQIQQQQLWNPYQGISRPRNIQQLILQTQRNGLFSNQPGTLQARFLNTIPQVQAF